MSNETGTFLLINLDRSPDRLLVSANLLAQANVDFVRIAGEDGADLSQARIDALKAPLYSQYHKLITAGEIGCYLSHIKCWEYIVENNLPYAVILEDDFTVKGNIASLHQYLANINIKWDCIKLIESPQKRKAVESITCLDKSLVRYNKVPARTTAYVMSKSGAQKMLAKSQQIGRPVDVEFQYWWERELNVFGLLPYDFEPRYERISTIDSVFNRKNTEKSVLKQCSNAISFKIKNHKLRKKQEPMIK
jgi:glycosyl transferase family 25